MFETNGDTGFWMTFDNGFKVSVQWGFGTYSEDRRNYNKKTSVDAEVAVFDANGDMVTFADGDSIQGWIKPEDVAGLLYIVSKLDVDWKSTPLMLSMKAS